MVRHTSNFLSLMAIGDAFGMKYEFTDHPVPVYPSELTYGVHPGFLEYMPGHYTDDTQMSLANIEILLARLAQRTTPEGRDFVAAWMHAFKRDPRVGYSRKMWQALTESNTTEDFLGRINPLAGTTGGASMRSAPFGLLADIETVKDLTLLQARLTHDTPSGRTSALFAAVATHYLHHGGPRQHLGTFLDHHLGKNWCSTNNGLSEEPGNGLKIAGQAFRSVMNASTLSGVLLAAVSEEKIADTDTVCAMAMAIASRCPTIRDDLPENLRTNLERGAFGLGHLVAVDAILGSWFPRTLRYAQPAP